jgi:branched-chain amino acid aminotransferase
MTQPTPQGPIPIELRPSPEPLSGESRATTMANPGFGRVFTEHMISIRWSSGSGWHAGVLRPRACLELDPAAMVFHYGQAIFEGLKAYRQSDGSTAAFRPYENAGRFQRSARRMAMPELPAGTFVDAIEVLVRQDIDWVPAGAGETLYLRPLMIATEVGLGVRPANEYLFLLLASPVGPYFPQGVRPVSVWLSEEFTRAAPGGTGAAKFAGNYAATLVTQAEAAANGCDQVVWLDAVERRWVEEMGGMNICFVYGSGGDARLMTPALTGTLLPGVTRDSLLTLATRLGYGVEEGRLSVEQWRAESANGTMTEAFACGTAAIITPIGSVRSAGASWTMGSGEPGPVTMRLRRELLDIQHGAAADPEGWMHRIC